MSCNDNEFRRDPKIFFSQGFYLFSHNKLQELNVIGISGRKGTEEISWSTLFMSDPNTFLFLIFLKEIPVWYFSASRPYISLSTSARTHTKEKIYYMHGWLMNMKFLPPYNFEDGPNFPKAKYLKVIYGNCLAHVAVWKQAKHKFLFAP